MVARSALGKANAVNVVTSNINDCKHNNRNSNSMNSRFQISQSSNLTGSLRDKLNKERQQLHAASSSRHSHFGGTLVVKREGGDDQIVSAATASSAISPSKSGLLHCNRSTLSQVDAKRKTKKHQYFIGSGRPVMAYYSRPDAVHSSCTYTGPISHRAQRTLHSFCCTFLTNCYGPVMKSLKAEFRKESNRLEEEDKVIFFRIVWFFCQWWRVFTEEGGKLSQKNVGLKEKDDSDATSIGNLVFTMDMFTFNMVLSSLDFYLEHKKYKSIVQTVSLYTEMVRLIHSMCISSDSMENIMGLGLMDLLFYKQDCLDKLPKLLTRWTPGTYPIDYLCDLIELTHMTLKILEANEKACSNHAISRDKKGKKGKQGKQEKEEPQDRVSRMKEKAAEFDTNAYMARKIISNQVMFMFTQLLSQYSYNAPRINDHIVAFFVRLCKFVVPKDDDLDFSGIQDEKADGAQSITLEPMLFNIHLITVMNEILNDRNLRHDKDFRSVIGFGSTLVRHYARTCEKNPMLFVETLFRHSFPHRYCETLLNNYVSEELKMIAEREILLEQHAPDDEEEEMVGNGLSDEEEEKEFEDEESIDVPLKKKTNIRANDDDQSDEEQEMDFDDDKIVSEKYSNDKDHKEKQVEFDDVREVTEAAPNKETGIDDRWNDRRVFIPKRQRQDLAKDSTSEKTKEHEEAVTAEKNLTTSNEDEPKSVEGTPKRLLAKRKADISDSDESEAEVNAPVVEPKPKRIKRTVIDDSSDEEEFGDTQITLPTQSGNKPIFDDSDDEE